MSDYTEDLNKAYKISSFRYVKKIQNWEIISKEK